MNTRLLSPVLLGVFTLCIGAVCNAKASAENVCAYVETRPFSFVSRTDAGSATVRIIGKDCKSATLVVLIKDEDGYGRFTHAALFHHLTAVPTDELDARDVEHVTSRVWSLLGPRRTGELQDWAELVAEYDGDQPAIDKEAYEEAIKLDRPYICVTSYYEGGSCYWLDPDWNVSRLLGLSDVY